MDELLDRQAMDRRHANFINLKPTYTFTQIDFYFCDVNDVGNFKDTWTGTTWTKARSNVDEFSVIEYKEREINIPDNHIQKLGNQVWSSLARTN